MRREEALMLLQAHQDDLRARGVRSLAIFGSVARNDARSDSDVDVLVEIERPMGFLGFAAIQRYLEEVLARRVDLVTIDAIKRPMRDQILSEAVRAA